MLNRQEVFNKVRDHLLTQKQRAEFVSDEDGGIACVYRAQDGKRCAIGCLIPDDRYNADFEGRSCSWPSIWNVLHDVLNLETESVITYNGSNSDEFKFLSALQAIHDTSHPSSWKSQLTEFAEKWSLIP